MKLGARIEGAGTSKIVIQGVEDLSGGEHVVIPDRIEAGTFMVAGAVIGDGITLENVCSEHLESLTSVLLESGHDIKVVDENKIHVNSSKDPKPNEITTEPYPGFPTDMQAQMCALFVNTPGISMVKETIFPMRFMHVPELKRMGANITLKDRRTASRIPNDNYHMHLWDSFRNSFNGKLSSNRYMHDLPPIFYW